MASTHEEDTFVVEEFEISDESDGDLFENMSDDGETFSSEEDDEDVGLESTLRSLKRFVYFLFFHTNIHTDMEDVVSTVRRTDHERRGSQRLGLRRCV